MLFRSRWSTAEHDLFLQGLQKYGKDWKAIANEIPTRTVVQVRTHAQKYFQKLSNTTTSRAALPFSRRKSRDYDVHRRPSEVEKREASDSSGGSVFSPISSDSPPAPEPSSERVPKEKPLPVTHATISPSLSMSSRATLSRGLSPRSPRMGDNEDSFQYAVFSHYGMYSSMSLFEKECNDNHDDMSSFGSDPSDINALLEGGY